MRIFFSVGEPSGDVHGALLIEQLRTLRPDVQCVGFGGPKMQAAGLVPLYDLTQLAVMFLVGVLWRAFTFIKLLRQAYRYFDEHPVDAVILVDYPGFNWWVARGAKRRGIPVFYYGAPQLWAWAPWRIRKIRRWVDHLLCQLPFETRWYAERNVSAKYVGHPFFDLQQQSHPLDYALMHEVSVASPQRLLLLPGSRRSEIRANLDCLLSAATLVQQQCSQVGVLIACYKQSQADEVQREVDRRHLGFKVVAGKTREAIELADVCIACSGSVSLELLAQRKPTVICFRVNAWQWLMQKLVLRVRYITLVNLMAADKIARRGWQNFHPDAVGAESVPMPEYLSRRDESAAIANRITNWLQGDSQREAVVSRLDEIARRFATPGASRRTAVYICGVLESIRMPRRAAA